MIVIGEKVKPAKNTENEQNKAGYPSGRENPIQTEEQPKKAIRGRRKGI